MTVSRQKWQHGVPALVSENRYGLVGSDFHSIGKAHCSKPFLDLLPNKVNDKGLAPLNQQAGSQ